MNIEKQKEKIRVAVHNGTFHADDVFAIAILKKIYTNIEIIRTRDEKELIKADIRVDVGLKNDPKTKNFDHHQKEGAGTRENGILYASCGLVWKEYGKKIIGTAKEAEELDRVLIQQIDAIDSGINICKNIYDFSPMTPDAIVDLLNPTWTEDREKYDEYFEKSVGMAEIILERTIKHVKARIKAKKYVKEQIKKSEDENIIILEKFCPWQDIIIKETNAKYVIFPNMNQTYTIRAVPKRKGSFENRKSFPKNWGGKPAEELVKITGIKDANFCHRGLFIAGAKTLKGAKQMAELAMKK